MQIRNIFLLIPLCLAQLATAAIIQRGADGTEYGATPEAQQLWGAVRRNNIEIVKNLVSESNVNSYTSEEGFVGSMISKKMTLLHIAASCEVAELLISCGAQLDMIDNDNNIPADKRCTHEVRMLLNVAVPWLKHYTVMLQSVRQLPQEKKVSYAKMAIGQGSYGNAKTILNVCESTSRAEVLVHIMLPMQSTTATAIRDELLADNAVYAVLGQSVSYRIRNNRISGSMVSHMCHYAPDAMATYRDAHGNTLLHNMAAAGMADGCSHMLSLLTNHTRGASSQASQVKSKLQNAGGFTPRDIAEEKLHATDCVNPSKYRRFIQAYDDALARYMQQRSLHNVLKNDQLTDIDIVLCN